MPGRCTRLEARTSMPRTDFRFALAAVLPLLVAATTLEDPPMRGFTTASARTQREWEAKFRAIPAPSRMRDATRRLAAQPHYLSSLHGKLNAEAGSETLEVSVVVSPTVVLLDSFV